MMATTIRLRPDAHKALKEIADITGRSLQDALAQAIEDRRRRLYLEGLNRDFAAFRSDTKASEEYGKELAAWDRTNRDGLEDV